MALSHTHTHASARARARARVRPPRTVLEHVGRKVQEVTPLERAFLFFFAPGDENARAHARGARARGRADGVPQHVVEGKSGRG